MMFVKRAGRHHISVDLEGPAPHRADCTCGWRETGFPVPLPAIRAARRHSTVHGRPLGFYGCGGDLSIPSLQPAAS